MPDPAELTRLAKAEARRLGFDLVGITTPDPPAHLDAYRRWLAAGRHGAMLYLASDRARERRADPRRILPECRSILVVGANYLPERPMPQGTAAGPRIAAYAQGDDYHEALVARLRRVVERLEAETGRPIPQRLYSDTGPLLERELAQRAGLGWIGKNTCLIHPGRGSYFLLAEALLGIDLIPDAPFAPDRCGSCTRCIESCPTGCILPDRTLDARRCLSYLTIELKGPIPESLRHHMDDWLFGCDLCQQACPWNQRFAHPTSDPTFQPRPFLQRAHLKDWLLLDEETYRRELRGSPLKRPKRRGLVRNAAVAAGNRADPDLVPALARALLEDHAPLARAHAAWALGRIGGPDARAALARAQQREQEVHTSEEIRAALSRLQRKRSKK